MINVGQLQATLELETSKFTQGATDAVGATKAVTDAVNGLKQTTESSMGKIAEAYQASTRAGQSHVTATTAVGDAYRSAMAAGEKYAAGIAQSQTVMGRLTSMFQGLLGPLGEVATGHLVAANAMSVLEHAARPVDALLTQVGGGGLQLGRVFAALTSPLALTGEAFLALGIAAKLALDAVTATFEQVRKIQAISGLSADKAHDLGTAMQLAGINSDSLTVAMFRMGTQIESGGTALTRLGVSVADSSGVLRNEGEVFLETRDKLSQIGNEATRSALMLQIFGRGARELAPIFAMNAAEFQAFMDKAGLIAPWSQEAQKQTYELVKAQAQLRVEWEATKVAVGLTLIPAVLSLIALWRELKGEVVEVASAYAQGWSRAREMATPLLGPTARQAATAALAQPATAMTAFPLINVPTESAIPPNPTVLKSFELEAQRKLEITDMGLVKEEARRKLAVAQGGMLAEEAVRLQLAALDKEEAATRAFYATSMALAAQSDDFKGNKVAELQLKQAKALDAIDVKRITLNATEVADEKAKLEKVTVEVVRFDAFMTSETRALAAAQIEATGTAEQKFVAAEGAKADALKIRAAQELKGRSELVGMLNAIDDVRDARVLNFQNQLHLTLAAGEQAQFDKVQAITETSLEKVNLVYAKTVGEMIVAGQQFGEAWAVTQARIQALDADTNAKRAAAMLQDIDREAAKRANILAIYQDTAAQEALIREKASAERLKALTTVGEAETKNRDNELAIAQQVDRANGNSVDFFIAGFQREVAKSTEFWGSLETAAKNTSTAMIKTLSDVFFDVFTQKVVSAAAIFQSLANSMLRTIADFLAQSVVRTFLGILFGTPGGGASGVAGAAAGGATGGAANAAGGVFSSALGGAASTAGGGLIQSLFSGAGFAQSLTTAFPGLANLGVNFGAGGVSGALFGLTGAQSSATASLDAFNFAVSEGATDLQALGFAENAAASAQATEGLIGTAGAASALSTALAAVGVAANLAFAGLALSEGRIGAGVGGIAGTIVGAIVGQILIPIPVVGALIGGALGGALGGLFGGLFDTVQKTREQLDAESLQQASGAAQGLSGAVAASQSSTALYQALSRFQSGSVGGTQNPSVVTYFPSVPIEAAQALATAGKINLGSAFGGGTDVASYAQKAGFTGSIPIFTGTQQPGTPYATFANQAAFFDAVRAAGAYNATTNPAGFLASVQAGPTPGSVTGMNTALTQQIIDKAKGFDDLATALQKGLDDLLKATVTVPSPTTVAEALTQEAARFHDTLVTLRAHAQADIDAARVTLLTETDPRAFLTQVDKIKTLISDRYNGELQLVQKWAAAMQQVATAWDALGKSLEAQKTALQLGTFGPTNPSQQTQVARQGFDAALAAFRASPSVALGQQVSSLVDPFLQAASGMFARPSPEFRAIFDEVQAVLSEIQGVGTQRQADVNAAIEAALGQGVTIASLTADNTKAIADSTAALLTEASDIAKGMGWIFDPNFGKQQLTDAQTSILLLAQIAKNTMPGTVVPDPAAAGRISEALALAQFNMNLGGDGFQHGTDYVPRTGWAFIHQGEAVLTPSENAARRSGSGGVTVQVGDIHVTGVADPEETARKVVEVLERRLRAPGRLRAAVQDVARNA